MTEHASQKSSGGSLAVVMLLIGLAAGAGGMYWQSHRHSHGAAATSEEIWTCGMHPQVIRDGPGTCPICGMALEPKGSVTMQGSAPTTQNAIFVDPVMVQNMGVRVATVSKGPVKRVIRAVGTLEEAQPLIRDINMRVSGWIEKLYVNTEGAHVHVGKPMFDLYSPEVQVAVDELIISRKAIDRLGPNVDESTRRTTQILYDAARSKLEQWGIDSPQVDQLSAMERAPRTVQIVSPMTGHVVEKTIVEGAGVQAGERALRIVDHSTLWLDAQIHAQDQPFIQIGQTVKATIEGVPGRVFEGEAIFVHPHIDMMTRTARLRIAVPNPDVTLRPGMFGTVQIESQVAEDATLIPREAVLDTGERQIVFLAEQDGHFSPRQIKVGSSSDDGNVQVLEGLAVGEKVVISGQFLLDSESRLREAIAKHQSRNLLIKSGIETQIAGSAQWRSAVDEMVKAYLAIAGKLGEMQTSDQPMTAEHLVGPAKALVEIADTPEQKEVAHPILHAAEAMMSQTLAMQRNSFKAVSDGVIQLTRRSTPSKAVGDRLYIWHCPMTNGSWIQTAEVAANPYYAAEMKQCADLKQTIATVP